MTLPPFPVPPEPVADEAARFAAGHDLAARAQEIDRRPAFPAEEFRAMGDAGLLGLHVPEALGGRGLPVRRVAAVLYALARAAGTTFAKLALQPEFCELLAAHGSPTLVERYFRPLVRGRHLIGNQVTEPGAGSDAGALSLAARRDGDRYLLTGVKSEAAFATEADAAIVYARLPDAPPGRVTAFLVPQDLPGIRRSVVDDLGERWMRRGRVEYDRVPVPADHRLGAEGGAFDALKDELTRERALLGAVYLGVARSAWEATVAHVGVRAVFGRPLARHEAVAFPLVEDWARLDAAWRYLDAVWAGLDAGADVAAEAALGKWMATDAALAAIDHAIQFHGGRGYSNALPFERHWRDVRSGAIAHGPSEIMHVVAARRLWGRPG